MDNTQANLRMWLEDPNQAKPGNIMATEAPVYTDPTKKLAEPEVSALIAYLRSLK
jgi:cytochrome c1